jgi:lipid II isoglutaminyl synthase (glutamine-hydrolysing)
VTVPPTAADSGWSDTPRGGRHAAPSPAGSYLPPPREDDDATNLIPRVPGSEPGAQTGDPLALAAVSGEPGALYEPASYEPASYEPPSYEPASHGPASYEPASYETAPHEPASYEPDSREAGQDGGGAYWSGAHSGGRHAGAEHALAAGESPMTSAEPGTAAWDAAGEQALTGSAPPVAADNLAFAATVIQPAVQSQSAGRHSSSDSSALRLVWIYPDLLSTYGDRGNLIVLARRARLRGIAIEPIQVNSDQPVPRHGDIYLLGGGEDLPQVLAAQRLRVDGGLLAAANTGAVVFAVCAGYQLIGSLFGGAQGEPVEGLGILDISSGRGDKRGVGEVVAEVDPALGIGLLTGFENHQGMTTPGPGAQPLARTLAGVGNGDGTEGAYCGRVLGTYLHGPALVRNPGLADLLLSWATGLQLQPLPDAQDAWTSQLRKERLAAVPVGAAVG